MTTPSFQQLQAVDGLWPDRREDDAEHLHWSWCSITRDGRKRWVGRRFAFVDEAEDIMALWYSKKSGLIELPHGLAFRLDYLEVAPSKTRNEIGGWETRAR